MKDIFLEAASFPELVGASFIDRYAIPAVILNL